MESASFHTQHHQFQQQLNAYSSLATLQPGHGVSTVNDWNPTSINLKDFSGYNEYDNKIIHYSTEEDYLRPKNSTTVHQTRSFTHQPGSNNELSFAKEKEMTDFPKFSSAALVHNPSSNVEKLHLPYSTNYNFKHEEPYCHDHLGVLEESLSLIDFFSRPQFTDDHQRLGGEFYASSTQKISACFAVQSLPSSRFDHLNKSNNNIAFINTNMSDMKNLSSSSSLLSSSLGLKLKADSDLLNLTYYSGGSQCHGQSTSDNQVPESSNSSSNSSNKRSASLTGIERMRPSSSKPKASSAAAAKKKPRLGSESSCSLIKVGKQKERERIAALQGLVSPFGKTDTASVLTEAIGYIQFLQDQIQTLSLPNNNSSGRKPYKGMLAGSSTEVRSEDGKLKQDLRSRGLCLMPISCTSSITSINGGSIMWTIPY